MNQLLTIHTPSPEELIIERTLTGKSPTLSFILNLLEGQEVGADRPRPKIGFQSNAK